LKKLRKLIELLTAFIEKLALLGLLKLLDFHMEIKEKTIIFSRNLTARKAKKRFLNHDFLKELDIQNLSLMGLHMSITVNSG